MKYKNHKQYRLKGFDYSGEGEYFVTICVKNHVRYFGKIENEKMIQSDIGKIVERIWNEIPIKFENVGIDAYQAMPDHFHGILSIKHRRHLIHQILEENSRDRKEKKNIINDVPTKSGIENNPMEVKSISLGKIIRWFKGQVTFESKKLNPVFSWQARYYDRVIRNEKEHYFIREYIENDPVNYGNKILIKYFNKIK
jgi:putative transposase